MHALTIPSQPVTATALVSAAANLSPRSYFRIQNLKAVQYG